MESVSEQGGAPVDLKKSRRRSRGDRAGAATIDRLPPASHQMEQGIIGCCLLSGNECLSKLIAKFGGILTDVNYDLRHKTILDELIWMYHLKLPIDVITLQQRLRDKQLLEQVGGIAYLSSLPDVVESVSNVLYYADIVFEKYILRKMISTCTDVVGRVYDHVGDVEKLLDDVERDILRIRPNQKSERADAKTLVADAHTKIEQMFNARGTISGLSTGYEELDKLTDGLHPGEMIVVCAYPGMGKSTLSGNIACLNALAGIPVGVFSLEMTPHEIMLRSIYAEARVNPYSIRDGSAGDEHFGRMSDASVRLSKAPFHIENCNGMTIQQILAIARRMKQQHGIKLAVVDYIQLVRCQADNREGEVSAVSRNMKSMAMELEIPVIALSQLNDDGKLAHSRAIGQDADSVWLIKPDGDKMPVIQPVKIVVSKHRNGATGAIPLIFEKCYVKFVTPPKVDDEDVPN